MASEGRKKRNSQGEEKSLGERKAHRCHYMLEYGQGGADHRKRSTLSPKKGGGEGDRGGEDRLWEGRENFYHYLC